MHVKFSYRTSESRPKVVSQAIASGTIATIPAGTRHIEIYVFHKTAGNLTVGGLQWDQSPNNSEQQLDLWINHSSPITVTCTGTGSISIKWT